MLQKEHANGMISEGIEEVYSKEICFRKYF